LGRYDAHWSGSWPNWFQRTSRHSRRGAADFRAKKLKTIGSDLGSAVRGFKKSMNEGDAEESVKQLKADAEFSESAKSQTAEKSEHKA
jgi:sec-independent protein translocase protein TatA